ncbi:MAG TPA: energy transducer TonB [Opitutaceae bacterium]|nr:energy transducer TonB [Opitutaceae bacterium]
MNHLTTFPEVRGARQAAREEAVGLLLGAGFSLLLFLGMAHFENFGAAEPAAEIEELRIAAMSSEPPPPPPRLENFTQVPPEIAPLSGLEVGASESPVSVAVVPPDLETLMPAATSLPRAAIQFGVLHAELKPKAGVEFDAGHVYQSAEVDQKPRALVRSVPPIPREVRGDAAVLRVGLLLVIGLNGRVESARVMESSGNAKFDTIVAATVRDEWLFSPAMRRGKKVRVLAQQGFRVSFTGGSSPYSLD